MILNLSDISNEPLQLQIIRQIRAFILNGELLHGENLPSIRTLARNNKVSVITVQRAYEILEREKLIHSRRGKGFFVSEIKSADKKKMAVEKLKESIIPAIKNAEAEGLSGKEILNVIKKEL